MTKPISPLSVLPNDALVRIAAFLLPETDQPAFLEEAGDAAVIEDIYREKCNLLKPIWKYYKNLFNVKADSSARDAPSKRYSAILLCLNTPLPHLGALIHHFAKEGEEEGVRALVRGGCNLNIQDHFQRTALHWAAAKGHTVVITILVQAGANQTLLDKNGKDYKQIFSVSNSAPLLSIFQ